ncbi:MAG: ChbG/HpnK family deacetylase [Abditibacteriota bacterium]|nr:ChbG/HpnK family deacetylase [Abditibacteriota bacterium]
MAGNTKKIIITADDYGMSRAVNDAIDQCIELQNISSTNIMVNMPFFREAQKHTSNKNVSLGLHWTLSCGKPVLDANEIPSLVDENGVFFSYPVFRKKYREHEIKDADIEKELAAQYKLYSENIGKPDYWNTHQNVHVDFGVIDIFRRKAQEYSIKRMRNHLRIYVPSQNHKTTRSLKWRIFEPFKVILLKSWINKFRKNGTGLPDGIIIFMDSADAEDLNYAFSNIQWNDKQVGELVIHPATECDSPYFGSMSESRIIEHVLYTQNNVRELLAKNNIDLVTFDTLQK